MTAFMAVCLAATEALTYMSWKLWGSHSQRLSILHLSWTTPVLDNNNNVASVKFHIVENIWVYENYLPKRDLWSLLSHTHKHTHTHRTDDGVRLFLQKREHAWRQSAYIWLVLIGGKWLIKAQWLLIGWPDVIHFTSDKRLVSGEHTQCFGQMYYVSITKYALNRPVEWGHS